MKSTLFCLVITTVVVLAAGEPEPAFKRDDRYIGQILPDMFTPSPTIPYPPKDDILGDPYIYRRLTRKVQEYKTPKPKQSQWKGPKTSKPSFPRFPRSADPGNPRPPTFTHPRPTSSNTYRRTARSLRPDPHAYKPGPTYPGNRGRVRLGRSLRQERHVYKPLPTFTVLLRRNSN